MVSDGATCLTSRCFCELVRHDGVAQPANAWSSLGFLVAGVAAILTLRPAARRERTLVVLLGAALVAVGVGSFLFHATLTLWGQFLDVLPMYAVGSVLLAGAVVRLGWVSPRTGTFAGVVLVAMLGATLWLWPESRRGLFAAVLLPGIVLELVRARSSPSSPRWLYLGLALLMTAYLLWVLDQVGVWCDPTSALQGHALWHLLGAAAGLCLAKHYAVSSGPPRRLGP